MKEMYKTQKHTQSMFEALGMCLLWTSDNPKQVKLPERRG